MVILRIIIILNFFNNTLYIHAQENNEVTNEVETFIDTQSDVSPKQNPIIIVPGIMGTSLFKQYDDFSEIWPRPITTSLSISDSFLNDLELDTDGEERIDFPILPFDVIRGMVIRIGDIFQARLPNPLLYRSDVFDTLLFELSEQEYFEGETVFVFPYDWRLSNIASAEKLNEFINSKLEQTGASQIEIIAHSMGGLVTKEYISRYGELKINNLFFIGVPHFGAPKALKALLYGDDMGISLTFKNIHISLLRPKMIKNISQNMSSVYELLPSQEYIEKDDKPYFIFEKYDSENYADSIKNFLITNSKNEALVTSAIDFHRKVDNLKFSSVKIHNIVGCGEAPNTVGYIEMRDRNSKTTEDLFKKDFSIEFRSGDGTVPIISATGHFSDNYYIKGLSHAELPSKNGLANFILAKINNVQTEILPQDKSVCEESKEGILVSKHSPLDMHIYDEEGNHIGPTEYGMIESGITYASYQEIEDVSYAFLPLGKKYRIENISTDKGEFDFYIEIINRQGEVIDKTVWKKIPIQNTGEIFIVEIGDSIAMTKNSGEIIAPTVEYENPEEEVTQESPPDTDENITKKKNKRRLSKKKNRKYIEQIPLILSEEKIKIPIITDVQKKEVTQLPRAVIKKTQSSQKVLLETITILPIPQQTSLVSAYQKQVSQNIFIKVKKKVVYLIELFTKLRNKI